MILAIARIVSLFAPARRGAIVLLLIGLAAAIVGVPPEPPSASANDSSSLARASQEPPADAVPDYRAISERPLFDASRQPWTAVAPVGDAVPKAPAAAFPEYKLVAVVIAGASRHAVLQRPNSEKSITLSIGQQLESWMVRDIGIDRVRFEAAGNSHDLRFMTAKEHH
jgi:hypothetical protein